jgi:hypothetical protein
VADDVLDELRRFGVPIFVPDGQPWEVAGVESTGGIPDGVLVFSDGGAVQVRTESATRTRQPISIRVENLQRASQSHGRVIVDEVEREITVAGRPHRLRLLQSHEFFSFVVDVASRVVSVAGRLDALETLAIGRVDDLALMESRIR